jgi:hypothetical protein
VVVERRRRHPGLVGDLADPGGRVAAGGEEADGGVADAQAGVRCSLALAYRSIDNLRLRPAASSVKVSIRGKKVKRPKDRQAIQPKGRR